MAEKFGRLQLEEPACDVYLIGWAAQWSRRLPGRPQREAASASRCPAATLWEKRQEVKCLKHNNYSILILHTNVGRTGTYLLWGGNLWTIHCCRPQETWDWNIREKHILIFTFILYCALSNPAHRLLHHHHPPSLCLFQCRGEQSAKWGYKQRSCDCERSGPVLLTLESSGWWLPQYIATERQEYRVQEQQMENNRV